MGHINMLYLGDTIDVMSHIADESIGLVLSDPPYGQESKRCNRKEPDKDIILNDTQDEIAILMPKYIKEAYRILKPDTSIFLFCNRYCVALVQSLLREYGFVERSLIVWTKNGGGNGDLECAFAPQHELIWHFNKGKCPLREGRLPDVLNFPRAYGDEKPHRHTKPLPLLETLIEATTDVGDIVFDGFGGSFSCAIAAHNTNRGFIGVELNINEVVKSAPFVWSRTIDDLSELSMGGPDNR